MLLVPIASCASTTGGTSTVSATCSGVGSTSSVAQSHAHDVCVLASDLDAPPEAGATYVTTLVRGHTHAVSLNAFELEQIARGSAVAVETTTTDGHTHAFLIQRRPSATPVKGPY